MIIRKAQLDALSAVQRVAARERISARLRAHWPDDCARLGHAALHVLVERGIASCEARGIREESDVTRYLNVAMALGADFEDPGRYPWIKKVIEDPDLAPPARIDHLCALVAAHLARKDVE